MSKIDTIDAPIKHAAERVHLATIALYNAIPHRRTPLAQALNLDESDFMQLQMLEQYLTWFGGRLQQLIKGQPVVKTQPPQETL